MLKVPVLLLRNRILLQVREYCVRSMRIEYDHNGECFIVFMGGKSIDSGLHFLCRICMLICRKHKILDSCLCLVLL